MQETRCVQSSVACLPPQQSVVGQFNDRTNDCPPLVRVHDPFSFVPATIPANHAVRRSDSVWRMRGKFFFFFSFLFLAQCPVSPPPIRYHSFVNSLRIIILQYWTITIFSSNFLALKFSKQNFLAILSPIIITIFFLL